MTKEELIKKFDKLQLKHGSKLRNSVYGGGQEVEPRVCLVFINPTAKNIATSKQWKGIRCQWLGTKQIWKFLAEAGLFDSELSKQISSMKPADWTTDFCKVVYNEVKRQGVYITNLAKCTQEDARELSDSVFLDYLNLLYEEIKLVKPKKIVLFGNKVSSIVLGKKISVREYRKKCEKLVLGTEEYLCYPVYYPVGNGFFNAPKAVEDLKFILNN